MLTLNYWKQKSINNNNNFYYYYYCVLLIISINPFSISQTLLESAKVLWIIINESRACVLVSEVILGPVCGCTQCLTFSRRPPHSYSCLIWSRNTSGWWWWWLGNLSAGRERRCNSRCLEDDDDDITSCLCMLTSLRYRSMQSILLMLFSCCSKTSIWAQRRKNESKSTKLHLD